jgi:hypothetical protein
MNMKRLIYLVCIIWILSGSLMSFGQKPVTVEENPVKFKHGEYPGLVLKIPEVELNVIDKAWNSLLEDKTKSEITIENGELYIFGAKISDIYDSPLNVYSKSGTGDSIVILEVVLELKPNEYVGNDEFTHELSLAKNYLFAFGRDQYAAVAKEQLKAVEKTLRLLEQKLEDLYSEKIKLEKSIVDSKNNISQSQDEIAILKNDIITLNDQLTAEKTALSLLKNEEAIKQKESVIKTIEKNKKRNMDLVNSDEKKIVDSNSAIESANLNITTNLGEQENLRYQINVQKEIVNTADLKYRNIINSNLNN